MHVVGVEREEAVDAAVDLAAQPVLDALADHRALLARNRLQIGVDIGETGSCGTSTYRSCRGQSGLLTRAVAQFEMFDTERTRKSARRLDKPALDAGVVRRRSAVDAERQRDERVAEQAALDLGQRQDADDLAAALGEQVVGSDGERPPR